MKYKVKVWAVLVCFLCTSSVWAGNFSWFLNNKSSGISDATLKEQISSGITDGDTNTPSLPKPWYLKVSVYGGSRNQTPEAGLILIERVQDFKEGNLVKCKQVHYGTYSYQDLLNAVRESVTIATVTLTSPSTCN